MRRLAIISTGSLLLTLGLPPSAAAKDRVLLVATAIENNFGIFFGADNQVNGGLGNLDITEFTTLSTAGAFDEGGNFIQVAYSPLSLIDSATGALLDYHVQTPSAAIDVGNSPLTVDIDDDPRPLGTATDIGADEAQ